VGRTVLLLYVSALCVWFVLSVVNQFRRISSILSRYDEFALLPRWTFFAPNPGIHDQFLIWRTADAALDLSDQAAWPDHAGDITPWRELAHDALDGPVIPCLWNPSRRTLKSILDLASGLHAPASDPADNVIEKLGFSYILFCEMVSRLAESGTQYQWAIAKTHGFQGQRSLAFVYMSDFHRKADRVE
jgi:hypothetical protein